MSKIKELYLKYSQIDKGEITQNNAELLRNKLKSFRKEDIVTLEEHQYFLKLLNLFRSYVRNIEKLNGDNYLTTIKEMLSVGKSGIYSDELHFLNELIQNVDDCEYDNSSEAKLDIECDWNNGWIILKYNEKGFTPYNVFAITGIAEQAKNIDPNKIQIGEKGLGFKSVFGVANAVIIQSGYFSFKLDESNITEPILYYDENFKFVNGTKLTLLIKPKKVEHIFNKFIEEYKLKNALLCKNPLIFLNKLSELRVYYDGYRSLKFTIERKFDMDNINKLEKIKNVKLTYEDGKELNEILCTHYLMPIIYNRDACVSRYGNNTAFQTKKMNMQIIVPNIEYVKENNGIKKANLYSFLPTKVEVNAPIICHIPFKLAHSREDIDDQKQNEWFQFTCSSFSKMIDNVFKDLAKTYKENILFYLPKYYENLFQSQKGTLSLENFKGKYFLSLPLFYTEKFGFLPSNEIYTFSSIENIECMKKIDELLNENKHLFLPPQNISNLSVYKIDILQDVTNKLFDIAISNNEKAEEIYKILETFKDFSFDKQIESKSLKLNNLQINAIFKSEKCSSAFKRIAKSFIKKSQRPNFIFDFKENNSINITQIDPQIKIDLSDFGENSKKYLEWIESKCMLSEFIPKGEYFITYNALLLSKNETFSSLTSFCHDLDPKDIFTASLQLRKHSKDLDLIDDSISSEEYMKKLIKTRKFIKQALGENVYNRYIKIINQSGTTNDRYINELLQNADDCEYYNNITPTFKLEILKNSKIKTTCNEKGFTKSNVRAITAIGESTKKQLLNNESIGEKGVGFKSVFNIANSVSIYSGDFSFKLSALDPTIPELISNKIEYSNGTTMIFDLKKQPNLNFTEEKVLRLCLCLRSLKNIVIDKFNITIKDNKNIRYIKINDKEYKYQIFTHNFIVDDEQALKQRQENKSNISKKQIIKFYIPIENKVESKYYLYSGLPTEEKINIPLIIDAPFELETSREGLIENDWNYYIIFEIYEALKELINDNHKEYGINILKFVNIERNNNEYKLKLFPNDYLNKNDFIEDLKSMNILPTWQKDYYANSKKLDLYRIPDLLYYILEEYEINDRNLSSFIKCKEGKYENIFNALGLKILPFEKCINILENYYLDLIEIEDTKFIKKLFSYLEQNTITENVRDIINNMKIIPVKDKIKNSTKFLTFNECSSEIFIKDDLETSTAFVWILNTDLLKKEQYEKIFGYINILTKEIEKSNYLNKIKQILASEKDEKKLFDYLLNEYKNNHRQLNECREYLIANIEKIPLINQFGEFKKDKIYISNEDMGYYEGYLLPSHIVHKDYNDFAKFVKCKYITDAHYDWFNIKKELVDEDIEALQDDSIKNGYEILDYCIKSNLIPESLMEEYNLKGIASINTEYREEDVFNQPIIDIPRFNEKMENRLKPENIIYIEPEIVKKTINIGINKVFGYKVPIENNKDKREHLMRKYKIDNTYCACQMCKIAKKTNYIEVNNIKKLPKFYWEECGVVLCLECSKHFEELRENTRIHNEFYENIKNTNPYINEPIKIPIAQECITFRQDHLAEIQLILKKEDELNN